MSRDIAMTTDRILEIEYFKRTGRRENTLVNYTDTSILLVGLESDEEVEIPKTKKLNDKLMKAWLKEIGEI